MKDVIGALLFNWIFFSALFTMVLVADALDHWVYLTKAALNVGNNIPNVQLPPSYTISAWSSLMLSIGTAIWFYSDKPIAIDSWKWFATVIYIESGSLGLLMTVVNAINDLVIARRLEKFRIQIIFQEEFERSWDKVCQSKESFGYFGGQSLL